MQIGNFYLSPRNALVGVLGIVVIALLAFVLLGRGGDGGNSTTPTPSTTETTPKVGGKIDPPSGVAFVTGRVLIGSENGKPLRAGDLKIVNTDTKQTQVFSLPAKGQVQVFERPGTYTVKLDSKGYTAIPVHVTVTKKGAKFTLVAEKTG